MSKLHKPRREGDGRSKKKEAIKASQINLPYWVLLPSGRSGGEGSATQGSSGREGGWETTPGQNLLPNKTGLKSLSLPNGLPFGL